MEQPRSKKDIQKLTGRIAALNRFISKSAERSLAFFKVLRGSGNFEWGPEEAKAFRELKDHLRHLTTLADPKPREDLILYISASHTAVSAVLIQEREKQATSTQKGKKELSMSKSRCILFQKH